MQPSHYVTLFLLLIAVRKGTSQCIDTDGGEVTREELSRCNQLFGLLENAFISNNDNLFALRRVFFPQTGLSSPLLFVNYNITSDIELMTNGTTSFEVTVKWSKSSFFFVINPYVLYEFLSGYVVIFIKNKFRAENILLSLNVSIGTNTSVNATERELIETLEIITNRLEAYAIQFDTLINWDGRGRGYIWEYKHLSKPLWLFLTGDIVFTIFAIWLVTQMYITWREVYEPLLLKKISKDSYADKEDKEKIAEEKKIKRIVFIFVGSLTLIPIIEIVCSAIATADAITICPNKECQLEVITVRVLISVMILVVGVISGVIGAARAKNDSCTAFFSHFIACFSVIFFINVIPVFIVGIIFPNEIIAAVLYLPTIGIILILYGDYSYRGIRYLKKNKMCNHIIILCHVGNFFLFVVVTTVLFVFSFTVYTTELYPSAFSTLLLPVILSGLAIVAKKFTIDQYFGSKDEQNVIIKNPEPVPVKIMKDTPKSEPDGAVANKGSPKNVTNTIV